MTTEEKIKGLEHLLRKCPDVITALEASRLIHVSKNSIHAAINEGKLIAYAYRGKRLISKAHNFEIVPREWLIDFTCDYAFRIARKSKTHRELPDKYFG